MYKRLKRIKKSVLQGIKTKNKKNCIKNHLKLSKEKIQYLRNIRIHLFVSMGCTRSTIGVSCMAANQYLTR